MGLLGFKCRCEYVFCSKHRHAEDHQCDFDFQLLQKQKLEKENPLMQHEKLTKF